MICLSLLKRCFPIIRLIIQTRQNCPFDFKLYKIIPSISEGQYVHFKHKYLWLFRFINLGLLILTKKSVRQFEHVYVLIFYRHFLHEIISLLHFRVVLLISNFPSNSFTCLVYNINILIVQLQKVNIFILSIKICSFFDSLIKACYNYHFDQNSDF